MTTRKLGSVGKLRRRPESEQFFRLARTAKQAMLVFIVDTAGCSQAEKGPLEARSGFPTVPSIAFS